LRSPHHTASAVALVGGGNPPRPGEISLAHHGILFLDELPEFDRKVLETLREPMESGRIHIARAARQAEFPAEFQLIGAMNPCPCGHHGSARCTCSTEQVARYRRKLSGPFLDRIDLFVEVPALPPEVLASLPDGESSALVRRRVEQAWQRQRARQAKPNARLTVSDIDTHCPTDPAGTQLLRQAGERLGLSARAWHRVLKVARTIADLADASEIGSAHIAEAIQFRRLANA
jgi:magnesium chelatase family protein